jgi:hypothetical protein
VRRKAGPAGFVASPPRPAPLARSNRVRILYSARCLYGDSSVASSANSMWWRGRCRYRRPCSASPQQRNGKPFFFDQVEKRKGRPFVVALPDRSITPGSQICLCCAAHLFLIYPSFQLAVAWLEIEHCRIFFPFPPASSASNRQNELPVVIRQRVLRLTKEATPTPRLQPRVAGRFA